MKQLFQILCLAFFLQHIVCEQLVNIALLKSPTQNGTLNYDGLWDVSNSVDGKTDCTNPTYQTFSGTDIVDEPWWQLDLGSIYNIQAVHVLGRQTVPPRQLVGFRLQVGFEENSLSMVYRNNDTAYNNGDIWINITMNIRIIKIDLPNDYVTSLPSKVLAPLMICEVEVYAPTDEKIKQSSNVRTSIAYAIYPPDLAIDGKYPSVTDTPEQCNCCSISGILGGFENSWLTIDFGKPRMIGGVYITGRKDFTNSYQSKDLSIFISSTSPKQEEGQYGEPIWHISRSALGNFFGHTFQQPRLFRFLSIIRPFFNTPYMTLCEIDFITTECGLGHYGNNCTETCGYCVGGNKTCMVTDGTCLTGCVVGYDYTTDNKCKTPCDKGRFGTNCNETCGQCINGTTACSVSNGTCPVGCVLGYDYAADRKCKQECNRGQFGSNCNETCGFCIGGSQTCLVTDGMCPAGCAVGYNYTTDNKCKTQNSLLDKCRPGQYGQNCESTCGHCIDGNTTCSITDGSCLAGCVSGYDYVIDMSCKTECQHGFYGLNCSETCGHCLHGATTCSVIDGTCPSGCKPGYNHADSTCKTGVNILQAPGFSVNTSQSSQHLGSDARRAIDGLKGPDPETCNCCSQTQNAEVSWWQVDMGVVLPIGEIVLYGQNDTRYQQLSLSGFSVYLSTSVSFPDVPFVKAHDDVANATYHIDVQGNFARYVRIQRIGVLIICEVEIFLSDKTCPPSTYTVYCIPCGHCYAGLPCDDITGRCPNGCETEYSGDTCNQAINTGTSYGTKDVIGAGIGGTIGGAIFILLIVMLVLRRKKLRCPWVCQTSQDYESPKPRENRDDQNMYDVLDIPDLSDQSVSGINPATPNYQNTNI